jgi:hypothetical protein
MGENPYAPRVYNMESYVDSGGNTHYDFDVERLLTCQQVAPESIIHLYDLFDTNTMKRYKSSVEKEIYQSKAPDQSEISKRITNDLAYACGTCVAGDTLDVVTDEKLFELLRTIKGLMMSLKKINQYTHFYDFHHENLMYRPTSVGMQLVINDPIA